MLEHYCKCTRNVKGTGFPEGEFKAFNVNMDFKKNVRTLHCNPDFIGSEEDGKIEVKSPTGEKLPYKKCYYAKPCSVFIPFDSLEEVEQFEKDHHVTFRRCGNCFPEDMR